MAEFITADDKRIYQLQEEENPLLNMFTVIDRPGNIAAMRLSLQALADLVSSNTPKAQAYASTVNPDNAFGNKGDLFFTVPADGSRLQLWQKGDIAWLSVFNLPLDRGIGLWDTEKLYRLNDVVTHQIGDVEYLLRSLIDDNNAEPTIEEGDPNWRIVGLHPNAVLQPWSETIVFTYNGSNNSQPLDFLPRSTGSNTSINKDILDPSSEYYFDGQNIVINTANYSLTVGIEYKIIVNYFR